MNRGDIYDATLPYGRHPVVIVTRDSAIPVLTNVTVVLVTSTIRSLRTEVPLGSENGLARDCVANCDNVFTVPKALLQRRRGHLSSDQAARLADALRVALELET